MSDWGATHSGSPAVNAGEDMDMPGISKGYTVFWHQHLKEAVKNGSVAIERLDDMCRRVMTPYYHLKQNEGFPAIDPSEKDLNALLFSTRKSFQRTYFMSSFANISRQPMSTSSIIHIVLTPTSTFEKIMALQLEKLRQQEPFC